MKPYDDVVTFDQRFKWDLPPVRRVSHTPPPVAIVNSRAQSSR
jgi:hypothetical protein